jgi:hypothetical protein
VGIVLVGGGLGRPLLQALRALLGSGGRCLQQCLQPRRAAGAGAGPAGPGVMYRIVTILYITPGCWAGSQKKPGARWLACCASATTVHSHSSRRPSNFRTRTAGSPTAETLALGSLTTAPRVSHRTTPPAHSRNRWCCDHTARSSDARAHPVAGYPRVVNVCGRPDHVLRGLRVGFVALAPCAEVNGHFVSVTIQRHMTKLYRDPMPSCGSVLSIRSMMLSAA